MTKGDKDWDRKPWKEIRNYRYKHQQQNTRDRRKNSGAKDTIEIINSTVKENAKCKMLLTPNIQEIQDTRRRPNLKITGIEESKDLQLTGTVNIFNKIIEEHVPNLKWEMPINIQEAYRTPDWTRTEIPPVT